MIRIFLPLIVVLLSAGCASAPKAPRGAIGMEIELFARLDRGSFVRYRVDPDGTIAYAGGNAALTSNWSWTGTLDVDQAAAVRRVVEANGRFLEKPEGSGRAMETREWMLRIVDERGARRFTVAGNCAALDALRAVLEDGASGRHAAAFNALPRAGHQGS